MNSPRIAAVTGASRGIGRATTIALARDGYRVFALARSERDLLDVRREASQAIIPLPLDIGDGPSRDAAVERIMRETNGYGVDVLINNAGYGQLGPVEEVPIERLRHQFEINVVGLIAFAQPFITGMRSRGGGRIVNVSSAAGRIATPFMGPYSASKFALEALSDAMRLELAPFGVRVILIEPGPIKTDFGRASQHVSAPDSPYARYIASWNAAHGANSLLERAPDAVAALIVRAIRSERPRARYTITASAKLGTAARRLVPDRIMDWALGRALTFRQ